MHKLFIALVVSALAVGSATADVQADVMSVVRQWADGFNKSDVKSIKASCADQASVVDDFPPHEWHGAGACSKWFDDFQTFATQAEITAPLIAVGAPWHVDVTGEIAYVVAPATLIYKKKGKPAELVGIVTLVLHRGPADWRITSLTWSDR